MQTTSLFDLKVMASLRFVPSFTRTIVAGQAVAAVQNIANSEKVATFNPCPYFSFGSLMQAPCFLLAYDIQQPKNRRRALKKLRKVADFYQDSVFDARLLQRERHQLLLQLADCLQSGDSLFCVRLGKHCQSWQLGVGLEPLTDLGLVIS